MDSVLRYRMNLMRMIALVVTSAFALSVAPQAFSQNEPLTIEDIVTLRHVAAAVAFIGISNLVSKVVSGDIPNELFDVHLRFWPWDDWQLTSKRSTATIRASIDAEDCAVML
jgi:hypothetical protein